MIGDPVIEKPFQILEQIIKNNNLSNPTDVHTHMAKYYENYFVSDESFRTIPCLNTMSTPNTIVRFRGIIQDVHNNELVTANYLYREPGQEDCINLLNDSMMIERELFYCIPIPGEMKWSRNSFFKETPTNHKIPQNTKRKRNDDEDVYSDEMSDENEIDYKKKRQHHEHVSVNSNNDQSILDRDEMLDFPIKGENGIACLVKLYGEDYGFKNTEIVDFVGILVFEASQTSAYEEELDFCNFRPEATLVPRLHVLFFKKHRSVFDIVTPHRSDFSYQNVRNQLLEYLTLAFGGDSLVAELLLYNLISRVRSHNFGVTLGKFILNIYNCNKDCAKKLDEILRPLLPSLHLFEMTRKSLEDTRLVPVKDYQKDKLKSGLLQLPSGTHLLIDENSLEEGNLFESALRNISHLSTLISTQKVDYDYSYHPLTMNVDIPIVIISKGKTLFQEKDVTCMVKLFNQNSMDTPIINNDQTLLLRSYISQIARSNYKDIKMTQDVSQLVSQTFVRNRVTDTNISERDLHNWLTLAELVHLSFGNLDSEMERSSWEHAMDLLNKIKQRI